MGKNCAEGTHGARPSFSTCCMRAFGPGGQLGGESLSTRLLPTRQGAKPHWTAVGCGLLVSKPLGHCVKAFGCVWEREASQHGCGGDEARIVDWIALPFNGNRNIARGGALMAAPPFQQMEASRSRVRAYPPLTDDKVGLKLEGTLNEERVGQAFG